MVMREGGGGGLVQFKLACSAFLGGSGRYLVCVCNLNSSRISVKAVELTCLCYRQRDRQGQIE